MKNEDLQVIVIGNPENLRNPNLLEEISGFAVRFAPPVVINAGQRQEKLRIRLANRAIFGRHLLDSEVGCSMAHSQARSLISQEWALILEDDAVITRKDILGAMNLIFSSQLEQKTIVTLVEFAKTQVQTPCLEKVDYMPGKTVAYFASKSVVECDTSDMRLIGTADWPFSFLDVNFYILRGLGVRELSPGDKATSTIDPDGKRKTGALFYYLRTTLFAVPLVIVYGPKMFQFAILKPFIRDIKNRFS